MLNWSHRHVAGAFDHHLHVVLPRALRPLAQRLQFTELRFVVGVVDRTHLINITQVNKCENKPGEFNPDVSQAIKIQ